jgi:acetyl-CoA carboxylase, biotin carboxyl carrier protein
MEFEQILKLIETVSKSSLHKFEYKEGDIKISFEKDNRETFNAGKSDKTMTIVTNSETYTNSLQAVNAAEEKAGRLEVSSNTDSVLASAHVVKSPLVGTFYAASSPEAKPLVKVGDSVKKGQVLGIIEAMKLMNDIESDVDGIVEAILVENEQVIEFDQPLFRIL